MQSDDATILKNGVAWIGFVIEVDIGQQKREQGARVCNRLEQGNIARYLVILKNRGLTAYLGNSKPEIAQVTMRTIRDPEYGIGFSQTYPLIADIGDRISKHQNEAQ